MALNRGFLFTVLVVVVTAAELVGNAAAATYVVGDSLGWQIPPNGSASYSNWASQHVFRVGDVLVFNFMTGNHDVARVTKGAFDGCSSTNPIALATVGPANFTLNATGEDYYICTFGRHCSLGQKLAINVTSSATSPAPAPGPSPPTAPAPAPTPTQPPSPSPSPTPSGTPSPSPSPAGAPSPGSTPSPTPGGSVTPPPAPASESTPGSVPPSVPTGGLSPPPPPSSATIATISAPLLVFASVAFGLMI